MPVSTNSRRTSLLSRASMRASAASCEATILSATSGLAHDGVGHESDLVEAFFAYEHAAFVHRLWYRSGIHR